MWRVYCVSGSCYVDQVRFCFIGGRCSNFVLGCKSLLDPQKSVHSSVRSSVPISVNSSVVRSVGSSVRSSVRNPVRSLSRC